MFKIGFWNYTHAGLKDPEKAASDWEELGFNFPMTFRYAPEAGDKKEDLIACLDACDRHGFQALVNDMRTNFRTLEKTTEAAFEEGVKDSAKSFGAHPAVYGFHVGDEPLGNQWETAVRAHNIVNKYAPNKSNFLNMLPIWGGGFKEALGCTQDEYANKVSDYLVRTNSKLTGFDYYGQCAYGDNLEPNLNEYFKCLNIFRAAADSVGGEFLSSLLSVGHWGYREPDDHDFRFQISTSIAHGASGWLWFYVYETTLNESYRRPIIDMFDKRTPNFDLLAWHNKTAQRFYGAALEGYKFDKVWHSGKSYGGTPLFAGTEELESIERIVNEEPAAITRFVNGKGEAAYAITNLCRERPVKIRPLFKGALEKYNEALWYSPGQMFIFTPQKRY